MQTNSPINPAKTVDEYKKIFCAYHKTQFLTNFCVHKNCLMPLCPSCIVDHTQQHYRQPSKPLYMNLHEALYDVKESCLNNIHQFESYSEKLREISQFKKKLVSQVHNQLMEHKQNIFLQIQRLFATYQHDVYSLVVNDYDKQGLYRQDDINQYQYKVQDTINQLYDKIGMIKGQQCLASLIMYYGEEREKIAEVKNDCQKFIFKHDNSKIDTYLNEQKLKKQLQNIFQNTISIQKYFPQQKQKKLQKSRHYDPIQRKTPQKNNINSSIISQSRRSKIFNQSGSKYMSPPKGQMDVSNKKDKNFIRYQSSFR